MNIAFKRVPIEKTLFLDLEVVRASEELEVIKEKAQKTGLSISSFLRMLGLKN